MGAEDRVENLDKEGYCSHGKMLQVSVWDTVRVRSLAELKASDGFLYPRQWLVNFGSLAGVLK
jgi:hypothetical protein